MKSILHQLSYIIVGILAIPSLVGCQSKETPTFDQSPSERHQTSMAALREELTSSPRGWNVLYFPRCDSLLFANPDELIGQTAFRGRLGYGGTTFMMKFDEEGHVTMTADYDADTYQTPHSSLYHVGRGTHTQLTFETFSYIHRLVDDSFRGATDFLYLGKNEYGQLIFGTAGTILPAKEYMIFTKIEGSNTGEQLMERAYEHRKLFEEMKNPQLSIRMGDRIYFESDNFIKSTATPNLPYLQEIERKRYYLFLYNKKLNPIPGYPAVQMTGLGSGYAGTPEGITFRPGLRYSKDIIFMDFKRVDDHFEAELVKVYEPLTRVTRLESRHLHPDGEPTGITAKIWDAPIVLR